MKTAVFTVQRNERFHLPLWLDYYSQFFEPQDLWIFDHCSNDDETLAILDQANARVRRIEHDSIFDHDWLTRSVRSIQRQLLEHYDYVVFSDADELIVPATETLREFLDTAIAPCYRCTGYHILENRMHRDTAFDKTLISKVPLAWVHGYHHCSEEPTPTPDLFLYHLHKLSFEEAWAKNKRWATEKWDPAAIHGKLSIQNQIGDQEEFRSWFYGTNFAGESSLLEDLHPRIARELERLGVAP